MKNHINDIERIIKDFIIKDGKYATGGVPFDLRSELKKGETAIPAITETLTSIFYGRFYAVAGSASLSVANSNTPQFKTETAAFVKKLSEANQTVAKMDKGWILESVQANGQITAKKLNSSQVLPSNEVEILNPGYPLLSGSMIYRKFPKENNDLQPVFYYAYSDAGFQHNPLIMRFYWNVKPGSAPALLKELSGLLNHYQLPFLYKCLNHPAWYVRRDSAILYIGKQFHSIMNSLLPQIYDKVKHAMNDDIPMFTHQLARGLGYADSPVNGDSFGMSRSRFIARALISGFRKDLKKKELYFNEVAYQFSLENVDPAAPYIFKDSKKVINPFSA